MLEDPKNTFVHEFLDHRLSLTDAYLTFLTGNIFQKYFFVKCEADHGRSVLPSRDTWKACFRYKTYLSTSCTKHNITSQKIFFQ